MIDTVLKNIRVMNLILIEQGQHISVISAAEMSGKMLAGLPVFMDIDAPGHRWVETPDIVTTAFLSAGINH